MSDYNDELSYIARNASEIRKRISAAAQACGRNEDDITVVAAVKYADAAEINYLHTVCGIDNIGENRVQQLTERYDALEKNNLKIHFIGKLQTNKVKYIVDKVDLIHSVDSEKLVAEIDSRCEKIGKRMDILCEINCGREENKSGIMPEDAEAFCLAIGKYRNVNLRGFMTMAPKSEKKEEYYKFFSETVELVLDIWEKKLHNIERPIISMGMSDSFEQAIACGSTMLRIGRSFFVR
jgi:pyridoxal phosphate enzyme (YggS family)